MDQPGEVANPARGQLNRENEYSPVPARTRLRFWSRETGSAVPSRVSLLILHTQAEYDAYSLDFSQFLRRRPIYVYNIGEKPSVILYTYYYIIAMQVQQNKAK